MKNQKIKKNREEEQMKQKGRKIKSKNERNTEK